MSKIKRCIITRYDNTITEPPFLTIELAEFKIYEPNKESDYLGTRFADLLINACRLRDYRFKFYTMSSKEGYDYEVVVY